MPIELYFRDDERVLLKLTPLVEHYEIVALEWPAMGEARTAPARSGSVGGSADLWLLARPERGRSPFLGRSIDTNLNPTPSSCPTATETHTLQSKGLSRMAIR
jgi:hypothetical protein